MNMVNDIGHSGVGLKSFSDYFTSEDAKIGAIIFPNTQQTPSNKQMDELTVVGLW